MNELAVRQLAQSDPVPSLHVKWIDAVTDARKHLDALTRDLRIMDTLAADLAEHGITVQVDLGPVGQQAAAARRDLEREKPGNTFRMPTGADRA